MRQNPGLNAREQLSTLVAKARKVSRQVHQGTVADGGT